MRRTLLPLFAALAPWAVLPAATAFQESGGLVVVEVESGERVPDGADSWSLQTFAAGYTGSGFLEWKHGSTGATQDGARTTDLLRYRVKIATTGTYRLQWRSSRPDGSEDKHNDAFVRFVELPLAGGNPANFTVPANSLVKCYHSTQNGAWGWGGTLDYNDHKAAPYVTFASPGVYTFDIGGRSNLFRLDRWVLARVGSTFSPGATDLSRSESPLVDVAGGGGTPGSPGTLRFSSAEFTKAEGDAGASNASLTVTRSGGSSGAVSVAWATGGGTATTGADYTAVSGTLTWAAGDSAAKTIAVPVLGDEVDEPDETVLVTLSAPGGGAVLDAQASATLTIVDDDEPVIPGTLQFSAAGFTKAEGDAGTANASLTVTRSGGSSGAVSVAWATGGGTATAGADYTAASGTLSWAAGDSAAKTITVAVLGDDADESDETVLVILSAPGGGAVLGARTSATLTIVDDDDPADPGMLGFEAATATVAEGDGGATAVAFLVTRTGGSAGAVGVAWSTGGGTATAGADYTAASGTLSWAAGDSAAKTITLAVLGDALGEPDETVLLTLSAPTGGVVLAAPATATLLIADDDPSADTTPPVQPAAPAVSGGSATQPRLTGLVEPEAAVSILDGGRVIGQAVADEAGTWAWTPPEGLAVGSHLIAIVASDAAGNASPASPALLLVVPARSWSAAESQAILANWGGSGGCGAGLALVVLGAALALGGRQRRRA